MTWWVFWWVGRPLFILFITLTRVSARNCTSVRVTSCGQCCVHTRPSGLPQRGLGCWCWACTSMSCSLWSRGCPCCLVCLFYWHKWSTKGFLMQVNRAGDVLHSQVEPSQQVWGGDANQQPTTSGQFGSGSTRSVRVWTHTSSHYAFNFI